MRILSILIVTLVASHLDQVSGKKAVRKGPNKGGPCGKAYLHQLNGRCYYVSNKKINWFGAQNNCLRKELNLADVSNPADFKALVNFLQVQVGMDDFWLGANDLETEGHFTYISNGRVVRYMGESGMVEPTQRSNLDDCLELRVRPNVTVMLDVNCFEKKYFICEKSNQKCARPSEDRQEDGERHSHEHLHHFHHEAAKREKQQAVKAEPEVESDSRPLDNSNSTEVGESVESNKKPGNKGEEAKEGEGDNADDGEGNEEETTTTADDNGETTVAEEAATGADGAVASPADGDTTAAGEAAPTDTTAAGDGDTTAAPADGAAAPAGAETTTAGDPAAAADTTTAAAAAAADTTTAATAAPSAAPA